MKESRIRESHAEHIRIVEHCLKNDFEAAAKAMEQHLASSKNAAFEVILKDPNWTI